jgi:hypothetical protein
MGVEEGTMQFRVQGEKIKKVYRKKRKMKIKEREREKIFMRKRYE